MTMGDRPLTFGQVDMLWFIMSTTDNEGRPPTFREIMKNFGWASANSVKDKAVSLESRGMLVRKSGARGVFVTEKGRVFLNQREPLAQGGKESEVFSVTKAGLEALAQSAYELFEQDAREAEELRREHSEACRERVIEELSVAIGALVGLPVKR